MRFARDTGDHGVPPTPGEDGSPWLTMRGIVKRYGPTTALNGVDLDVRAGAIHALLGENGAGKSTLMHVLSGLTLPDRGAIRLGGREVDIGSPRTARRLGIAMVHQHFTLVPAFTVAENLALDAPRRSFNLRFSPARAVRGTLERASKLGWTLDPHARVKTLPVGAQQRIEIVKALATDARLLIFDEPTALLAGDEVNELFGVLRRLRDGGASVILIAHKLSEILAVADRVTVLRSGNHVTTCHVAQTDARQLAAWMVGTGTTASENSDGMNDASPENMRTTGERTEAAALRAVDLVILGDRGETAIRRLSFEAKRGAILGFGGVDGNGQTELAEALAGLRPVQSGSLRWEGRPFAPGTDPRIGYIPQDRRRAGLSVTMTIEENLLFEAALDPAYRRGPFLHRGALRELAAGLVKEFDIRTPDVRLPTTTLSGGNQQKVVVARALRADPECIIAVNPTRGLDIGATRFVHRQLRRARARGAAIVLITTDLDELAALSDTAAIVSGGRLSELDMSQASAEDLGLLLGGLGPDSDTAGETP